MHIIDIASITDIRFTSNTDKSLQDDALHHLPIRYFKDNHLFHFVEYASIATNRYP